MATTNKCNKTNIANLLTCYAAKYNLNLQKLIEYCKVDYRMSSNKTFANYVKQIESKIVTNENNILAFLR